MNYRTDVPVLKLLLLLIMLSMSPNGFAGSLDHPAGKVILTVSGNIGNTNSANKAEFDRDMLEALCVSEITVETRWTEGRQAFRGVLARKILDAVAADGEVIVARAINDYEVRIPLSDMRRYPVLFALKQNGSYMRVRDKGPIWIIYTRETFPEIDTEEISDRWVWQLSEIVIE